MSSRTPTECVALATDDAATDADREAAIHELRLANECDELTALVWMESLEETYRHQALEALVTSQCDSMLSDLVSDGVLEQELHEAGIRLLDEREGT